MTKKKLPTGVVELGPGHYRVWVSFKSAEGLRTKKSVVVHGKLSEAVDARARLMLEWGNGRGRSTTKTLGEMLADWYRMKKALQDQTQEVYEGHINNHILPALGSCPLGSVTTRQLDHFFGVTLVDKGLAPATIKKTFGILHQVFELAWRWDLIMVNPMARCSPVKVPKKVLSLPEWDSVASFLGYAMSRDPVYGRYFWLSFYLGPRRGEVLGMRYSDIDFTRRLMRIERSVSHAKGKTKVKGTKTENRRWVPISAKAMALLEAQVAYQRSQFVLAQVSPLRDFYLFSDPGDGSLPWRPARVSRAFRLYKKRHPIDLTLKQLRHLHATMSLSGGLPLADVQSHLGHASAKTTADIYVGTTSNNDELSASILDALPSKSAAG